MLYRRQIGISLNASKQATKHKTFGCTEAVFFFLLTYGRNLVPSILLSLVSLIMTIKAIDDLIFAFLESFSRCSVNGPEAALHYGLKDGLLLAGRVLQKDSVIGWFDRA